MYRWEYTGLNIAEVHWVWVRRGGNHDGHEVMGEAGGRYKDFYRGGGSFESVLAGPYQRVMMSHRADLPEADGYCMDKCQGFAKNTHFREYTGFTSPLRIFSSRRAERWPVSKKSTCG